MSLKKITHCKIVPSFLKNSLKIAKPVRSFWRRYATNSRMKFHAAEGFLERQEKTLVPRPTLSARSPFVRDRVFGEEKREELPLPQHEPGHLALMPPLRPARRMSLYHQQNILNGNRMPSYSDVDSDPEDCTSALEKVRRMEESRKVHKKMIDLMQQQNELNQLMQDQQDLNRGYGGDGGIKPGVSRWASKSEEEEQPVEEQPAPAEEPDVVKDIKGTRLGSLESATALVSAEINGKPPRYSNRSLQMPLRRPSGQVYRPEEVQYHRHQKAYIPRNMVWPDYSASTTQLHKKAVTPPKGKLSYKPRNNSDDYDSDDGDGIKESTKSVRPKVGVNTKPPMAMTKPPMATQDVFELHKARASEVEKRAIEGLSKKSATSRVVGQNGFMNNYKRK